MEEHWKHYAKPITNDHVFQFIWNVQIRQIYLQTKSKFVVA